MRETGCVRLFCLGLVLMGVVLGGCGETVEDVDRVQPHYVEKSKLDGEWYYRQTVVDRPPQYSYLFTGIEGGLEKIRWDVRESQLIAYRTHSAVRGLDDDAVLEGAEFKGDPVAIFAITSHFDIIRDFNSATGEQSNVLVENGSLRPWYERDYMRVSWDSNMLEGPVDIGGFFSQLGAGLTAVDTPLDDEIYNPDRQQIESDRIFFTNLYVATDGGYSCFYNYGWGIAGGTDNCGYVEVKIRNAFVKIDADEAAQFEAIEYDDRRELTNDDGETLHYVTVSVGETKDTMVDVACTADVLDALGPEITREDCKPMSWQDFGRFGYFRSERYGYDRRVGGGHDHSEEFYANHHQMWKRTKNADGTTIPKSDRDLRPIVYYLNPNFPEDLKASAIKIGDNWNDVFMAAAIAATGRDAGQIQSQLESDTASSAVFIEGDELAGKALFQVRENSCSQRGIAAYLARNPSMGVVALEAAQGQEVKPGNLERVCAGLEHFSKEQGVERFAWQQMGDLRYSYIWWVNEAQPNGPLGYGPSSADIESGQIISGNAHVYGAALDSYARSAADVVRALNGDLDLHELLDGHSYLEWIQSGSTVADNPAMPSAGMQAEISRRIGSQQMDGYRPFMNGEGRMDKVVLFRYMGDRLKNTSATDPIQVGLNKPQGYDRAKFEQIIQNPKFRSILMDEESLKMIGPLFGWKPGDDIPAEMEDLALEMALDPSALQKRHDARMKFYSERNVYLGDFLDDSVVGLALELRGLPAEEVYQRLRRELFEAVMLHEVGHTVGLRHNFKASYDALNYQDDFWEIREQFPKEEWNQARLPEYRYTSIMDYGGRFNSDMKGLGRYDFAAIKYLYGGHAEVFDDSVNVPGRLDLELELIDYSKIPDLLGGDRANLTKRQDRPVSALIDEKRAGVQRNAELLVENRDRSASDFWVDRTVPYYFCTDSFNGDLKCRTWDEGSNQTEAVQSAIQRYWNYYLFNSFRRGRDEGAFIGSFNGRQARVRDYLVYPWQYYYFYDAYPVDLRDDLLTAAMMGLNFVNQVLGTPEPGKYCQYTNSLYLPASVFNRQTQLECNSVDIGVGAGRDQYFKFSDEHVYKMNYIGSFFDKQTMLSALVVDNTRFFRVTDDSDMRAFTINYYRVFKEEMLKLVRDMMMSTMMNWIYIDGNPSFVQDTIFGNVIIDGQLRPQLLVDPARFDTELRATTASAPKIYTQVPYNLATRALLYGVAFNTNSFDQTTDFLEYVTISEVGSGDDREVDAGADVVVFTHPMTGQSYSATQTEDGRSIAYELLALGNEYVRTEWEAARQAHEADPGNENFERVYERIDRQLQEFVEMMDYLRELRSAFDPANRQ